MNNYLNKGTQILLPFFTILGSLLISFKMPGLGLIFNLIAQVFWLYSGWKAWKKADQMGIFVTSVLMTIIILFGIINYWLIK